MPVEPDDPPETLTTVTLIALEVDGPGFTTVTGTVPTWAAVAVPVAVSWVEERKVVVSGVVPKSTCAPERKPVPVSVKVNGPTMIDVGETEVRTGGAEEQLPAMTWSVTALLYRLV